MSKRAEYHVLHRFGVEPEQVSIIQDACSPSDRYTWVSVGPKGHRFQERLRVHTLKGVPGKKVDLLFPDTTPNCCEVGVKKGCFDGAERFRITFRTWPHFCNGEHRPTVTHPGVGKIVLEDDDDQVAVICLFWGQMMWAQSFPRLRFLLDQHSDLRAIFMWQWKSHYMQCVPEEDARQDAEVWSLLPETVGEKDIVVLNRSASRMLYARARQLGWRKLTLRERLKIGLSADSPQWHRASSILLRETKFGSVNGAGQYTNEAASGTPLRTSYGEVDY